MTQTVAARAEALRRERVPFVHARVVRAERPTSAKPGDEALVLADGTVEGFVGGSCAEATVREQSLRLLESGEKVLLRITPRSVEVAEEPGRADPPGTVTVSNPCLSGGTLELFLEPVVPPPLLAVLGKTPIARAVTAVGGVVGYHVVPFEASALDGAAAVVLASHGGPGEEDALRAALAARVPYVGLVASRTRGEAVVAELGLDAPVAVRAHTPAGLDIGARTPEEVALAILAEIVASRPRTLREARDARGKTACHHGGGTPRTGPPPP
jgi:xanthine dehydrogenase accessory factor